MEYAQQQGWSDDIPALHEGGHEDHPITQASREIAVAAIRRHGRRDGRMLEVGSCFGHTLSLMIETFPQAGITASDTQETMLAYLRERYTVPVIALDILSNDLPDASYDAVVALNVFEHIEDDFGAAREVARILKPGGIFVCEVPAGPMLYDGFDALFHHYRRYDRARLAKVVTDAGLSIVERGAIGAVIYPAFWIAKKVNRLRYGTSPNDAVVQRTLQQSENSVLLSASLGVERHLRKLVNFPFGIRHTIVAAKPR